MYSNEQGFFYDFKAANSSKLKKKNRELNLA